MQMKKKSLSVILVCAIAVICCLPIFGCGKSDKKLEVVAVSEKTYATEEAAIRAYIAAEFNDGSEEDPVAYLSHEIDGTAKAANTTLTEAQQKGLNKISQVIVTLRIHNDYLPLPEEVKHTIYLLDYPGAGFGYMVTPPENGERLTWSYVEKDLADMNKYKNCTLSALFYRSTDGENFLFRSAQEMKINSSMLYRANYYNEDRYKSRKPGKITGDEKDTGDDETYYIARGQNTVVAEIDYADAAAKWVADTSTRNYDEYLRRFVLGMFEDLFDEMSPALLTRTKSGISAEIKSKTLTYNVNLKIRDGIVASYTMETVQTRDTEVRGYRYTGTVTDVNKTKITVPDAVMAILEN